MSKFKRKFWFIFHIFDIIHMAISKVHPYNPVINAYFKDVVNNPDDYEFDFLTGSNPLTNTLYTFILTHKQNRTSNTIWAKSYPYGGYRIFHDNLQYLPSIKTNILFRQLVLEKLKENDIDINLKRNDTKALENFKHACVDNLSHPK